LEKRNAELAKSYATTRENFDLADHAVRGTLGIVNLRQPQGRGIADPLRKAVNETARDYYQGFVQRNGDRPELEFEVAFACLKQGQLASEVGPQSNAEATQFLDEARRRFEKLHNANPNDPRGRYGLAGVDLVSAHLLIWQLKVKDSKPLAERAAREFDTLCTEAPPELQRLDGMDSPAYQLAQVCLLLRDLDAALDPHDAAAFPQPGQNRKPGALLTWLRKAEAGMRRELQRQGDTAFECRGLLPLLEICIGEELAIDGHEKDGLEMLKQARRDLVAFVKDFPTFYEHEAMLVYVDFLLSLEQHINGKPEEAVKQLAEVRTRALELANRQWGVDDYDIHIRTWGFVAMISKVLGDWTAEKDLKKAEGYYREALDALAQVTSDSKRTELPLRVQAVQLTAEIAEKLILLDMDVKLARAALEKLRKEVEALTVHIGEMDWVRHAQGLIDVLLGGLDTLEEKDGLPQLDRGIDRLETYLHNQPNDRGGRIHLALGHFMRGTCLAMVHKKVDDGLRAFQKAREVLAKIEGDDEIGTAAKNMDRLVRMQSAILHWMAAEDLLDANKPELTRSALDHIVTGLKILDEIAKTSPLNDLETQVRQQLQTLKAKAEKQLKEK
jgi:hypothetical protein